MDSKSEVSTLTSQIEKKIDEGKKRDIDSVYQDHKRIVSELMEMGVYKKHTYQIMEHGTMFKNQ